MSAARSLAIAVGTTCLITVVNRDVAAMYSHDTTPRPARHRMAPIPARPDRTRSLPILTPQTDDFTSGNQITAVNGTAAVNLDPSVAYDNTYTVNYRVQVTVVAGGLDPFATLFVAIETNDGSGWVERASFQYYREGGGTSSWNTESKQIVVSGLDLDDDIRLRAKSFVLHNAAGSSFVIRGADGAGANPDTRNGVTYTSDYAVPSAQSDDFSSGSLGLSLDPGGGYNNNYTVHYYLSVTINGHPSDYGTATLDLAIETNDGSGWVERTSNLYNCGYPSGPPPYSSYTCPEWSHVQKTIAVAGLGVSDSIRLKVKSFTVSNNAGGSFVLRGGDGAGPNPETYNGVTYGVWVSVLPDGDVAQFVPATGTTFGFLVTNPYPSSATYGFTLICTGAASCSTSPASQSFGPFETREITGTFSVAGALGATGMVKLRASDTGTPTNKDSGWVNVTVAAGGAVVERSLCLTIAAGKSAAYSCGDLQFAHALPSVRTLNKVRTATLLYNSQHAHPHPIVQADVTLPGADPLPQYVRAILKVNGVAKDSGTWAGSDWLQPGQTRRVTVAFDAVDTVAYPTGLYSYELEIRRITGGSNPILQTFTGSLPIVNRANSPFGPGWWLAGFERLYFNGIPAGQVMWVDGDGSVRRYDRLGVVGTDTVYLARPVDHPDTLLHKSDSTWVRLLPGGDKITFSSSGFHIKSTNRLGYVTRFVPDGSQRLDSIKIAPDSSKLNYDFTYGGSPVRLTSVTIADSAVGTLRTTTFARLGDTLSITDPSSPAAKYIYSASVSNRIVARRDRRGAVWNYGYDAGYLLNTAKLLLAGGDSIMATFCPAEVRGIAGSCSPGIVVPDSAYTVFDGARTDSVDVMHFWADSLRAVFKVRDPYGLYAIAARGDARWPALPTRFQHPNGWVQSASYDARGNLASSTDSSSSAGGVYATTRYMWDQRWDELTRITRPLGQVTDLGVDPTNGNRVWQQDGRGFPSRVTFDYYTSGKGTGFVRTISLPGGVPRDSIAYDTLGNFALTRSPLLRMSYFDNDRLGRLRVVRVQGDSGYQQDSSYYDVLNRVVRKVSVGPARFGMAAQNVYVRTFYSNESEVDSLQRWSVPSPPWAAIDTIGVVATRWRYDLAGRAVAEISPDLAVDSTRYDPAGNAIAIVPRRGAAQSISMTYDRLNRLRTRVVPNVPYPERAMGIGSLPYNDPDTLCCRYHHYPYYPLDPSLGDTVPGYTGRFDYDAVGNVLRADNNDAFVRRTYLPNGLVQTETLKILTYGTRDSTKHVYVTTQRYDLQGRLVIVKHPSQLAPRVGGSVADSARYVYSNLTGALDTVIDPLGKRFTFTFNNKGERIRLEMPGLIFDSLSYDADGRWLKNWMFNRSQATYKFTVPVLRQTDFTYIDGFRVNRAANAAGWMDTSTTTFTGLGQLRALDYIIPTTTAFGHPSRAVNSELYMFDPLGNLYDVVRNASQIIQNVGTQRKASTQQALRYSAGVGRHRASSWNDGGLYRRDTIYYDAAGNIEFSGQTYYNTLVNTLLEDRALFYGADGRLKVSEYRSAQSGTGPPSLFPKTLVFEEFRYDALGRRVMVRTRRNNCPTYDDTSPCRLSTIRRTVWLGSRELYEIQMPAGDTVAASTMDNDTLPLIRPNATLQSSHAGWDPNPQFGRLAYVHGSATDQPLGLVRINFVDKPFNDTSHVWPPLTLAPHWNWRGQADLGTFGDGAAKQCITSARCTMPGWRPSAFGFGYEGIDSLTAWYGSLISSKEDGSGLGFRRTRYVDPATGRFTQEDPIGLAGGLNLYGFGNADPVTFDDPFGLCPSEAGGDGHTDLYSDCPQESSGYYAYQAAMGRGGSLNDFKGAYAWCKEHPGCKWTGIGALAYAGIGLAMEAYAAIRARAIAAAATAAAAGTAGAAASPRMVQLFQMIEEAGPRMATRIQAIQAWIARFLPPGHQGVLSELPDGINVISGGVGQNMRQIILFPDGRTVITALNVMTGNFDVIRVLGPK